MKYKFTFVCKYVPTKFSIKDPLQPPNTAL